MYLDFILASAVIGLLSGWAFTYHLRRKYLLKLLTLIEDEA
jgi:hypothetical protein